MHALLRGSATNVASSSGDTIPNCLGEFREIKERTGITAIAIRQACLNKLGLSALATRERSTGERRRVGRNGWICPQESPGSAHNEIEGSLVEIGPRSVFLNSAVGIRHSPAGEGPRTT